MPHIEIKKVYKYMMIFYSGRGYVRFCFRLKSNEVFPCLCEIYTPPGTLFEYMSVTCGRQGFAWIKHSIFLSKEVQVNFFNCIWFSDLYILVECLFSSFLFGMWLGKCEAKTKCNISKIFIFSVHFPLLGFVQSNRCT